MYFFVKLDDRKAAFLKLLMHKNNIFSHISPSFIGAQAPFPHLHRSMNAYISTNNEIMTTQFLYVSLSLPISFLSVPFSPLFFFGGGGSRASPWICACSNDKTGYQSRSWTHHKQHPKHVFPGLKCVPLNKYQWNLTAETSIFSIFSTLNK